jgi:molybdopterin-guanine dinucleotide biosynthesis protein B
MTPILSIVGRSGSGKTTLIERLLPALIGRGARVATVKHHRHRSPVDVPGKDSWRHARAGASAVVVAGAAELALFRPMQGPPQLEAIVREFLPDVDLVLTEGFKEGPAPKIEINRSAQGLELLCGPADHLVAVVTDRDLSVDVPVFGLDAIEPLADFLEAGNGGIGARRDGVRAEGPWADR